MLGRPILWYGFFFALGFFLGYLIFKALLKKIYGYTEQEAKKIAEKTGFFVGIGAIAGARCLDVLFYQDPTTYVHDFLAIFRFWEGGLASHGGAIGILISLFFLRLSLKKIFSWKCFIDLLAIPALIAGACIRVGNFFNQEIVGIPTELPWGVLFAHPADGALAVPRHPVQLYEGIFYLLLALKLWRMPTSFQQEGKIAGLFFIYCFGFRFVIEFLKTNQSPLLLNFPLDMGQLLSIPFILFGFFWIKNCKSSINVEGD